MVEIHGSDDPGLHGCVESRQGHVIEEGILRRCFRLALDLRGFVEERDLRVMQVAPGRPL